MQKTLMILVSLVLLGIGSVLVFQPLPWQKDYPVTAVIGHPPPSAESFAGAKLADTSSPVEPGELAKPLIRNSDDPDEADDDQAKLIRNYEELWAQLDLAEQESVSKFSARYSDALRFYNNGQMKWMQRNGYPMPKDILAAERMGDEELTKLAASGNTRALAMLVDRLITESAELGRDLLEQGLDPFADQEFFLVTLDLANALQSLYRSGTPFAGYMDARSQMEVYGIKTPESEYAQIVKIALKGLAYAESNGDHLATNRALWLADEAGVDSDVFRNYVSYHGFLNSKRDVLCDPGKRIQGSMPYGRDP